MTLHFIRKKFGTAFNRAFLSTFAIACIVIFYSIYPYLFWSFLSIFFSIILFIFILSGIIAVTGFEGVTIDLKKKNIVYFSQILGFKIGKKSIPLELGSKAYVLIFDINYTDNVSPLSATSSFYEVSIIDSFFEKHQVLETIDYTYAKQCAYKLSKFLNLELRDNSE